ATLPNPPHASTASTAETAAAAPAATTRESIVAATSPSPIFVCIARTRPFVFVSELSISLSFAFCARERQHLESSFVSGKGMRSTPPEIPQDEGHRPWRRRRVRARRSRQGLAAVMCSRNIQRLVPFIVSAPFRLQRDLTR